MLIVLPTSLSILVLSGCVLMAADRYCVVCERVTPSVRERGLLLCSYCGVRKV